MKKISFFLLLICLFTAHSVNSQNRTITPKDDINKRLNKYVDVTLSTDVSGLTEKERRMLPLLIEACVEMDKLFWKQAFGGHDTLLPLIKDNALRKFVMINYGPWDRLAGNEPFIKEYGSKPDGANFYPINMTKDEFEKAPLEFKTSEYTLLRREDSGVLKIVPYHEAYSNELKRASELLLQAADLAEDEGLQRYLQLRSEALITDQFKESDMAWLDMKNNSVDVVIGPIETYEDKLFGYKAAYEGYVLIKDKEWSDRLSKYAAMLPELQRNLPVAQSYKSEEPGTDSDLNAYDVVYYAGDCNAGSKTIAINLPNDEEVQLAKGTRRLQLKNAMRAKFDHILMPIGEMLIVEEQREHITFDAFFSTTMFHEIAHGLGIKNTVNGKGTVRETLKELGSALEEGKADVLGLFMITQLHDQGELGEADLMDYYVTFLASIFRSIRFGASSAHGQANMVRFNYFREMGAFSRDESTGTYKVDLNKMRRASDGLSALILKLQGDGDYNGVAQLMQDKGIIQQQLQRDLDRLRDAGIPVDVTFTQGKEVLGL
ncbi:MAG: dipeptidyl-peptidase 3 family protein [Bacteroidia bacterium]